MPDIFVNPTLAEMANPRRREHRTSLTEADLPPSLLTRVMRPAMSGLAAAGNLLDLPGSMMRDVLSGQNPFHQILSPISPENRVSGRQMLETWGMLGKNKAGFDWGDVAGFGADVLTDPTTYLSGGMYALTIIADLTKAGFRVKRNYTGDNTVLVARIKEGKASPMFNWSWGLLLHLRRRRHPLRRDEVRGELELLLQQGARRPDHPGAVHAGSQEAHGDLRQGPEAALRRRRLSFQVGAARRVGRLEPHREPGPAGRDRPHVPRHPARQVAPPRPRSRSPPLPPAGGPPRWPAPRACPCDATSLVIFVAIKSEGSFTQADLAGTWDLHVLGDSIYANSPQWGACTLTVEATGALTPGGTCINDRDEAATVPGGALTIDPVGQVAGTLTLSNGHNGIFPSGKLDPSKRILTLVESTEDLRGLFIAIKGLGSFTQADLA